MTLRKPRSTEVGSVVVHPPFDSYTYTDEGNASRFIAAFGKDLRYDHTSAKWYKWEKHWWAEMPDSAVYRAASGLIHRLRSKAIDTGHIPFQGWMHSTMSGGHIQEIIKRARNFKPIAVESETAWNREPMLFAVANGVVDLTTGQLRDGQRKDMVNAHSPVIHDADATSEIFDNSLTQILCQREDLINYILKTLGYSLSGLTTERCMFILYGTGSNGKSKLLELLTYILGDYAKTTSSSTLKPDNRTNPDAPRNDLARLSGARFVTANESDLREGMAESMVKWLTGGDTISCRFGHGRPFEYRPQFKIFLSCNNRPLIRGIDNAIWDRLPLIPFEAAFKGSNDDKFLIDKWKAEASGILNRLIAGCLRWQREGLIKPECVQATSGEYRTQSNPISPFLEARCNYDLTPESNLEISPESLWEAYAAYMRDTRQTPIADIRTFKTYMESFGFEQRRTGAKGRFWRGVALLSSEPAVTVD